MTVFHFKGVESSNKPTIMGASETKPQKSKDIFEIGHIKLRYLLSFDNNIKISILKRYLHYFLLFHVIQEITLKAVLSVGNFQIQCCN